MPIHTHDWISRTADDSLTSAGVTYVCRTIGRLIPPYERPTIRDLRRIVSDVSVELCFRRWLHAEDLPYRLHDDQPFTHPDRPSVIIGGRRIDINCVHLCSRRMIRRFHHDPKFILSADALHPTQNFACTASSPGDLIVFALHLGQDIGVNMDPVKLKAKDVPSFLIAIPKNDAWRRSRSGSSLGKISASIQEPEQLVLEIDGRLHNGRHCRQHVSLAEKTRATQKEIASLFYVHPSRLPSTTIKLYSPTLNQNWFIRPYAWHNLWVYTNKIYFLGWFTRRDFHRRSRVIPPGTRTEFPRRVFSDHRAIKYRQLRPMRELIQRIRQG